MRSHSARQRYLALRRSTILLQSAVRSTSARRQYNSLRSAAILVQSWRRRAVAMAGFKRIQAAISLQTWYRTCKAQQNYRQMQRSAVAIQSAFRAYLARKSFCHLRAVRRANAAATTIQAIFRGAYARRLFAKMQEEHLVAQQTAAATTIQAFFRGIQARQLAKNRRQQKRCAIAATTIQASFRAYMARRSFTTTVTSIVTIQRWIRSVQLTRRIQLQYRQQLAANREAAAATTIQAYYRGLQARRAFFALQKERLFAKQTRAAVAIQALYRGYMARRSYTTTVTTIVTIQRWMRSVQQTRTMQRWYRQQRAAATTIQRWYRSTVTMTHTRKQYLAQRGAAITIQQHFRGHLVYSQYQQTRRSVVIMQTFCRAVLAQKFVQRLRIEHAARIASLGSTARMYLSVVRIQRWYRQTMLERKLSSQISSITMIQSWWRAKSQRMQYLRTRSNVIVIQRAIREWREQRQAQIRTSAAIRIQSWYRGHIIRKQSTKRMTSIRRKVIVINANVTEDMKLGNRARSALEILLTHKQLTFVLRAVENLDAVTKLSFACCEAMVQHNAVSIIFQLIRSCNRSKPHMAVLYHALRILLHLTRCKTTINVVFAEPDGVVLLGELLQMYRDKRETFQPACQILGLFAQHDVEMKAFIIAQPGLVGRLKSVQTLLERKAKMESKLLAKKKGHTNQLSCLQMIKMLLEKLQ